MSSRPHYAAVILSAGLSSRMGALKPLLPLGEWTVLGRLIHNFHEAGIEEVVVVTGHERDAVAGEVTGAGAQEAHNPDYQAGMFTSVQAGVRALSPDITAFFMLPVDCALVNAHIIGSLAAAYVPGSDDLLHPTCCGHRGHPPLIAGSIREVIVSSPADTNLRIVLQDHAPRQRDLEVEDAATLFDMDTPEDYARLTLFASALDGMEADGPESGPRLSDEVVSYLQTALRMDERVVRHCEAVAAVAVALAEALDDSGADLDIALIRTAARLHDLAKNNRRHATSGEKILTRLGLPLAGAIVGAHMVLPDAYRDAATADETQVDETQVVYLADKLVAEDRLVGLEARRDRALAAHGHDEDARAAIARRMGDAEAIAAKVERATGREIMQILEGTLADRPTDPQSDTRRGGTGPRGDS